MSGTSPGMTLENEPSLSSETCASESRILFGGARGADKFADHLGILDAGRPLDARGDIDAAGAGDANCLRDISGIEPARDHEGQLEIEIFQHMPVERGAQSAGAGGALRRPGIEQDAV